MSADPAALVARPAAIDRLASHEAVRGSFSRCLLLYSGGLDTSVMVKWIQEEYACEVVCLTMDLGQTADNLEEIRAKALKLGAVEAVVIDAKNEMAELCCEAISANADYQGGYALGCPLGRVQIARVAVRVAKQHGCKVIAHGCTGKGNDQVRFEGYITSISPSMKTIAPVRDWAMGRDEELAYAAEHGIPVKQTASSPYSYDENFWSNTAEGGEIEDPAATPNLGDILLWCKQPEEVELAPQTLSIVFEAGRPVSVDGSDFGGSTAALIAHLNRIGGAHGCGFHILVEDRIVGLKVRGIYENPAASILIAAHKKLEYLVSSREENEFKSVIDQKWSYLVYGAKYFDGACDHIRAYLKDADRKVTGTVRVRLCRGNILVVALEAPYSLLDSKMVSFDKDFGAFNCGSSPGFIELWNLSQKTQMKVRERVEGTTGAY